MKKTRARFPKKIRLNLKLTMLVIGFFFSAIIIKLSYVVLSTEVDGINLTEFANNRNTKKETLYASRGIIYDVDGKPLAKNANSYKIIAILSPTREDNVKDIDHTATSLCDVLAKSEESKEKCQNSLKGLLNQDLYQVELGTWGYVTEDERQAILALDLDGIEFVTLAKKRQYINSSWASYILGYARSNESGQIIGEMGIESYFDEELKGKDGYVEYQKDAYGFKMPTSDTYGEDAVPGSDIYLTINTDVQNILENTINNFTKDKNSEWSMFAVMNAKTGEIIGSATSPNFNPNTLEGITSYVNPLVGYQIEPGSTMKIFSWLAALENNIYNGEDKFLSGTVSLSDGTRIKDFNNAGWGEISYDTGFKYSSNVAATALGLKLGVSKLTDFYESLGFGFKTGITLPGEATGVIDINYESELANASFGQGILVTPLQLMQAMTIFANKGTMIEPYIISKIVDSNKNVTMNSERKEIGKVVSEESVQKMLDLMYGVVYEGFDYNKAYAPSNVSIAGKTGTAQIASSTGGYLTGTYDYIKSFLGVFPYENPEYVFYFATKKYTGNNIYSTISNTIKDVANIVNVVQDKNDVDSSKIVYLGQEISKEVALVLEELKKKGLAPIVIGNGKYVTNQYPLQNTKVVVGSKVFLKTNGNEIKMPDVKNWSTNEIIRFADLVGVSYRLNGYGKVLKTNIEPNTVIDKTQVLEITLENGEGE